MMSTRFPVGRDAMGVWAAWRGGDGRAARAVRAAALPTVLTTVLAGVAFVVAACGTSGSSGSSGAASPSPAGTSTLTGTAANALIAKALADTQAASSFRVQGQGVATGTGGQTVSFELTLVKNKGCQGMIALSK